MRRLTMKIAPLLLLGISACGGVSTEQLQAGLTRVEQRLQQTETLLNQAEKTLATTQFALQEAMDQGFGPEAIARAQNAVFRAESVVNDIKNTLTTVQQEKENWQSALDDAVASGATNIDLTKIFELGATSLLSILGAVKTTNLLRDKARVARNEPTGKTPPSTA